MSKNCLNSVYSQLKLKCTKTNKSWNDDHFSEQQWVLELQVC